MKRFFASFLENRKQILDGLAGDFVVDEQEVSKRPFFTEVPEIAEFSVLGLLEQQL